MCVKVKENCKSRMCVSVCVNDDKIKVTIFFNKKKRLGGQFDLFFFSFAKYKNGLINVACGGQFNDRHRLPRPSSPGRPSILIIIKGFVKI